MAKHAQSLVIVAGLAALAQHWMIFSELAMSLHLVKEGSPTAGHLLAANRTASDVTIATMLWHWAPAGARGVIWIMQRTLSVHAWTVKAVDLIWDMIVQGVARILRWLLVRLQPVEEAKDLHEDCKPEADAGDAGTTNINC
jgi:hypothetical protein